MLATLSLGRQFSKHLNMLVVARNEQIPNLNIAQSQERSPKQETGKKPKVYLQHPANTRLGVTILLESQSCCRRTFAIKMQTLKSENALRFAQEASKDLCRREADQEPAPKI